MVKHFNNQNYNKLSRQHQQSRTLFTDPTFPANAQSLWHSGKNEKEVVWKRPSELCTSPKLVVDGVSPHDLNQGHLGNCWFIAACTSLALDQKAWHRVVPDVNQQEWDDQHAERYAGIFHFHFWRLGNWVDVVVDDLLPTINGQLVYMSSKSSNEFWSALLEKAYAKMAGCYEALSGGQTGDAMVDFTGGVDETIDLVGGGYRGDDQKRKALFKRLRNAHDGKSFMSCSIRANAPEEMESKTDNGLIRGHAYCVVDVRKVKVDQSMFSIFGNSSKLFMIKMRNPWGEKEWTGPWSDGSAEWKRVPNGEKKRMGFTVEDDGEFWMDFSDWLNNFTNASICRAVNTSFFSLSKTWHEVAYHGEWGGNYAGGSINNRDTFLQNPQYSFEITSQKHGSVMVSLLQKDTRNDRSKSNLSMGFNIMKVEENRKYRLHVIHETVGTVTYINSRSVFESYNFPEGRYVVIPTTFEPGQQGTFMLRIFTENNSHSRELKKDVPSRGMLHYLCCCCTRYPDALVTVHLDSASGLAKQDFVGEGADPYCIVKCGGKKATTHCVRNTLDPKFDARVSFYVTDRTTDAVIQVWNSNVLVDRFMGRVTVPLPWQGDSERHTKPLMGRGRNSNNETQGKITVSVSCSRDLQST